MVGNSWPLIDKLWLELLVVISGTCLRFPQLFDISLYPNSSFLVQLFITGFFSGCHLAIDLFHVLCRSSYSLKYFISIRPFCLALIFSFLLYLYYLPFRYPAHATRTDLDVYVSIISHIVSVWYRDPNTSSIQEQVWWTLHSANIDLTVVGDIWPYCPSIFWAP